MHRPPPGREHGVDEWRRRRGRRERKVTHHALRIRPVVIVGVTADPVDEGSTVYLTVEPRHCVLLEG